MMIMQYSLNKIIEFLVLAIFFFINPIIKFGFIYLFLVKKYAQKTDYSHSQLNTHFKL